MKMRDCRRIYDLEMWCYRRFLQISWMAHQTNESILKWLGIRARLLTLIKQKQLKYFGHTARRPEAMERFIIEGNAVDDRRPPERSPFDHIKSLAANNVMNSQQISHHSRKRDSCRQAVNRPAAWYRYIFTSGWTKKEISRLHAKVPIGYKGYTMYNNRI